MDVSVSDIFPRPNAMQEIKIMFVANTAYHYIWFYFSPSGDF